MATITITITAGAQTAGRTKTVSAGDLQRFLAAFRSIFGANLSDPQVIEAWADNCLSQTKDTIRNYENQSAAQTAVSQQTDITIT
jgi:hypothetical protein